MALAISRRSLTVLASLTALGAVATTSACAMSLNNSVRISPAMGHVDSLGGRFGPHTDRIFGPAGDSSQGFAECYRRAYLKLEKADASMGSDSISAKARQICGA